MNYFEIWLAAILLGPGLILFGLWRLYIEIRPRRWISVKGVVTQSRIERQYAGHGGYQNIPVIEFEFSYESSIIYGTANIFTIGSRESAAATIERYPSGTSISVLVNPQNPRQTCLKFQITPGSWLFILIGILFSVIEVAILF